MYGRRDAIHRVSASCKPHSPPNPVFLPFTYNSLFKNKAMKFILFSMLLVLTTGQVYGQKKAKVDPKDGVIDSLTTTIQGLEAEMGELRDMLESTQQEVMQYEKAREVLKTKVVKYDFPPAAMPMILDTMMTNRTKTVQALHKQIGELKDEILILQADNSRFQQAMESMKEANADPDRIAGELRQLKNLLDMGILTQEEFDQKKAKLLAKWE